MILAYGHPATLAADLLVNGTRLNNVRFFGIERFGDTGIINLILEFFQSIFV